MWLAGDCEAKRRTFEKKRDRLWIQLLGLSALWRNDYIFKGIARGLGGKYLVEDGYTRKWDNLGFVRLQIEVPVGFIPAPLVTLHLGNGQSLRQEIVYGRKILCFSLCGAMSHVTTDCQISLKRGVVEGGEGDPLERVKMVDRGPLRRTTARNETSGFSANPQEVYGGTDGQGGNHSAINPLPMLTRDSRRVEKKQ